MQCSGVCRDLVALRYVWLKATWTDGVVSAFAVRVSVVVKEQVGEELKMQWRMKLMMPWIFGSAWSNRDNVPWYPEQVGLQSWRRADVRDLVCTVQA